MESFETGRTPDNSFGKLGDLPGSQAVIAFLNQEQLEQLTVQQKADMHGRQKIGSEEDIFNNLSQLPVKALSPEQIALWMKAMENRNAERQLLN